MPKWNGFVQLLRLNGQVRNDVWHSTGLGIEEPEIATPSARNDGEVMISLRGITPGIDFLHLKRKSSTAINKMVKLD
ncbi:MAG: hypothetical protein OEW70_09265 [candidate division WOR-3 bacterium]|nr:hypothetical protein [candidate division WOR-3 bacterium]